MKRTLPSILQWDETFDIGSDTGTPVDGRDYQAPFKFTGQLHKLVIKLDPLKLSSGEEQFLKEAAKK